MMFNRVSEWLDAVLKTDIPKDVAAFGFNLYEDGHYNWSMELIGASEFDIANEDWLCSEVTDFNTRDNPLRWHREADWEEILHAEMKEKIRGLIEQKISEWKEDDIYAISLYVSDEEDDPCRPVVVLGYNTERQVQKSTPKASDEQEAQDESRTQTYDFCDGSVTKKNGKKTTDIRLITAFIMIMALIILLCLGIIGSRRADVPVKTPQLTEDFEEETSMPSRQEETESGQMKWQVYIQPDMPEPFIEVLRQYEQFMNAEEQNLNDEGVQKKMDSADGEWRYLYDELCGMWMSAVLNRGEEDVIRYSLEDLTGDGYPELVMGYSLSNDTISPQVVYYYSQTEGIRMECLGSYYTMVLYEDGIIEYISGGVTYTETYLKFQEETESWQMAARVIVDWDSKTDSVRGYYWGDDVGGHLTDNRPMSEEEYQKIISQYATEPMELEWTPLILSSEPVVTETEVSTEEDDRTVSVPGVDAEKDSFFLRYVGDDRGIEIFFKDCTCEYDREGIRVYTYFLDDPMMETEGYAICIQTQERTKVHFAKDYLLDKDAGCLYSLLVERRDGMDIFTRIQAKMVNGTADYVVANTFIMENLIATAHGLEYLDNGEDFDCQQVELTGLYEENGKTVLCGKASAIYNASGEKYSIEWEIDTETTNASALSSAY